jgi:CHAT domain-containing protein
MTVIIAMVARERVSLPTALLDASAWGVIASLWPVEDEPSVTVMRALYTQLRRHRPAVALARMQAEMVQQPAAVVFRCASGLAWCSTAMSEPGRGAHASPHEPRLSRSRACCRG